PPFECGECGACCRQAFDAVEVRPREPMVRARPELLCAVSGGYELRRSGGFCPAVVQEVATRRWRCAAYEVRPRSCAEFEHGSANCLLARKLVGASPAAE